MAKSRDSLIKLLNEVEDIALKKCDTTYTKKYRPACYGGVWSAVFEASRLDRLKRR